MRIRDVILIVSDISVSQKFYERLGFKLESGEPGVAVFKTDHPNQRLVLRQSSSHREEPGKQIASFTRENVQGYFQKCKIMGVAFEKDLRDGKDGQEFAFRDPDGNKLEIYQKVEKKKKELKQTEESLEETHQEVSQETSTNF